MPRDAGDIVRQLRSYAEQAGRTDAGLVVVAPNLSETAREQIVGLDASYIDSTGNILVRTRRPALFIEQDGAKKDPWPSDEALRTLKGRGAEERFGRCSTSSRPTASASSPSAPRCRSVPCHERSTCSTVTG